VFIFSHSNVVCSTQDKAGIPKNWILLDSQSTVDTFSNAVLFTNIRDAKSILTLDCNAGKAIVTLKGDLKVYGTVWYYPKGIANILSLYKVQENTRLLMTALLWPGFKCTSQMVHAICLHLPRRAILL